MLIVSDQVAATFAGRSSLEFRQQLAQLIVDQFPEYAQDRFAVAAAVDVAVHDGEELGLQSAQALAMYGLLAFLLGIEVKDDPRLQDMLLSSGLNERGKADAMAAWLMDITEALES